MMSDRALLRVSIHKMLVSGFKHSMLVEQIIGSPISGSKIGNAELE